MAYSNPRYGGNNNYNSNFNNNRKRKNLEDSGDGIVYFKSHVSCFESDKITE